MKEQHNKIQSHLSRQESTRKDAMQMSHFRQPKEVKIAPNEMNYGIVPPTHPFGVVYSASGDGGENMVTTSYIFTKLIVVEKFFKSTITCRT